jgi:hypothetical protein
LFSDQLVLLLVARTRRELVALTAFSQIGFVVWFLTLHDNDLYVLKAAPFVLVFVFIPALVVVLRQPRSNSAGIAPNADLDVEPEPQHRGVRLEVEL